MFEVSNEADTLARNFLARVQQTRADRFFEFRDADNCRRVWTAISSAFPPTE
jgi:hypothetical protein